MTSARTNYGIALEKQDSAAAYATVGEVVSIDPPEMMQAAVEATNHGSGGVREFIAGGLTEFGEFKATLNYVKAAIASLYTDMRAGTKGRYRVMFDSASSNSQLFGALITSIKPLAANAQSPDVLQAEVTFRPSDSTSITS